MKFCWQRRERTATDCELNVTFQFNQLVTILFMFSAIGAGGACDDAAAGSNAHCHGAGAADGGVQPAGQEAAVLRRLPEPQSQVHLAPLTYPCIAAAPVRFGFGRLPLDTRPAGLESWDVGEVWVVTSQHCHAGLP